MDEYSTKGLDPAPSISMTTVPMAGLLVDVYGLNELAPTPAPLTCLWLLHPRTRNRGRMQDIACRVVHAWHQSSGSSSRGVVALSFDMPNHGTRLVSKAANHAWDKGNGSHALDMAGMVRGGVGDMSALMDLVAGYLGRVVDRHVCLGWSLGGHSAWQAWFGEERIDAAVVIVGCPDYIGLMSRRAEQSNLSTGGESFLGSKYFPPDLLALCQTHDPKSILFGANESPPPALPLSAMEKSRLREVLDARIRGKKLLACSGAEDKLVPYTASQPMLDVLTDAVGGWYKDGDVVLQDKVYAGAGHTFSAEMVKDAIEFLVGAIEEGRARRRSRM